MSDGRAATAVIGVGNEYRGDDAAGLEVARSLSSVPSVKVLELPGEGSELIEAMEPFERVFIVDASRSQSHPGEISDFDVSSEALPVQYFNYSTHAFGVAEAIEVARSLGRLPKTVRVFGIEGMNFDFGLGLSEPVRQAVREVAGTIRRALRSEPAS
ncbi:MAG: hydrogenase maturation protease [Rhodothermales bacterium]|nr:hydrogenase maturation protease [Rhodothermales bacterium]